MLRLDEAAVVFEGSITGASTCKKWYRRNTDAVRIAVNRWFFVTRPALNMPCHDKGMLSRATRGDLKLGANGCWGTRWSEERLVASLTATPKSSVRSGAERIPVFWTPSDRPSSSATVWYAEYKGPVVPR